MASGGAGVGYTLKQRINRPDCRFLWFRMEATLNPRDGGLSNPGGLGNLNAAVTNGFEVGKFF